MKHKVLIAVAGAIALGGVLLWPTYGTRLAAGDPASAPMCIGGHCCCILRHSAQGGIVKVAAAAEAAADRRPSLDPNQFAGEVRQAYQAAKDNPVLFSQLHCYCGCDVTAGHKNLLDCYRDHHGATCATCTGEALQAQQMYAEGSPVEQIQDALGRRFAGKE